MQSSAAGTWRESERGGGGEIKIEGEREGGREREGERERGREGVGNTKECIQCFLTSVVTPSLMLPLCFHSSPASHCHLLPPPPPPPPPPPHSLVQRQC